eukprot:m.209527 g.209527  ORF g.209527 m.209527 type:complete len:119 (-) comp53942_c0_seq10:1845-2201(-)
MAGPEAGQIINPTFWDNGQPDNTNNQDCVMLWTSGTKKWDDASCDATALYIIEFEPAPQGYGGHFYQLFTGPLSWTAALAAASQTTYNGSTGPHNLHSERVRVHANAGKQDDSVACWQ